MLQQLQQSVEAMMMLLYWFYVIYRHCNKRICFHCVNLVENILVDKHSKHFDDTIINNSKKFVLYSLINARKLSLPSSLQILSSLRIHKLPTCNDINLVVSVTKPISKRWYFGLFPPVIIFHQSSHLSIWSSIVNAQ